MIILIPYVNLFMCLSYFCLYVSLSLFLIFPPHPRLSLSTLPLYLLPHLVNSMFLIFIKSSKFSITVLLCFERSVFWLNCHSTHCKWYYFNVTSIIISQGHTSNVTTITPEANGNDAREQASILQVNKITYIKIKVPYNFLMYAVTFIKLS